MIYAGRSTMIYAGRSTMIYAGRSTMIYAGRSTMIYAGRSTMIYAGRSTMIYAGRSTMIYAGRSTMIYGLPISSTCSHGVLPLRICASVQSTHKVTLMFAWLRRFVCWDFLTLIVHCEPWPSTFDLPYCGRCRGNPWAFTELWRRL